MRSATLHVLKMPVHELMCVCVLNYVQIPLWPFTTNTLSIRLSIRCVICAQLEVHNPQRKLPSTSSFANLACSVKVKTKTTSLSISTRRAHELIQEKGDSSGKALFAVCAEDTEARASSRSRRQVWAPKMDFFCCGLFPIVSIVIFFDPFTASDRDLF